MRKPPTALTAARPRGVRSALLACAPALLALALAALTLYAYRNLPGRPFAADDYQWLLNVQGRDAGALLRAAFDPAAQTHFYRPLVWLLFWGQLGLFGLEPRGFHWVSLALHLLNAALLGGLAFRLAELGAGPAEPSGAEAAGARRSRSALNALCSTLAAAAVALHPAAFEAVVWVSAQSELAAAALLLLMLHLWLLRAPGAGRRPTPLDAGRTTNDERRTTSDERRATSDERRATSDERRATSDERRATSDERRATNDERRATNDERRTTSDERRTTSDERRTTNDERRTTSDEGPVLDRSSALSLYRSIALSLYRSIALSLYRSTALPLYRSTALPLYRSTAPALLATLALGLALLAKESAAIGLPLLVLAELWIRVRASGLRVREAEGTRSDAEPDSPPHPAALLLPLALTLGYLLLQVGVERRNYLLSSGGYGLGWQLALNPLRSLGLLAAPLPGSEHADAAWLVPLGGALALALLGGALALALRRRWGAPLLLAALALTLLPTAPFVSPPDSRYLYLPAMVAGLSLALALAPRAAGRGRAARPAVPLYRFIAVPLLLLLLAWPAAGELAARENRFAGATGPGGSLWRLAAELCAAETPPRLLLVEPPIAPPHAEAIVRLACGPQVRPMVLGRGQIEGALEPGALVVAFPGGSAAVEQRR